MKRWPTEAGESPFKEIFKPPPDKGEKLLLVQGTSRDKNCQLGLLLQTDIYFKKAACNTSSGAY